MYGQWGSVDHPNSRAADQPPERNDLERELDRGVLGDEELSLYRAAMNERLDPELAEWLENGSL